MSANNNFASRSALPASPVSFDLTGDTFEATEYGTFNNAKSIWFTFVPGSSGWYDFSMDFTGYQKLGSLFADQASIPTNSATALVSFYDNGYLYNSVYLTSGTTYLLQIRGSSSATTGTLTYGLSAAPANDNFANRFVLASVDNDGETSNINTFAATEEASEPNVSGNDYATLWLEWTAPSTANYKFATKSYDVANSDLYIYTGATLAGLTQVLHVTKNGTGTLAATSGTVYKIQIRSLAPDAVYLYFGWWIPGSPPPANDNIANAIALSGAGSASGTTVNSTTEVNESADYGTNGHTVWYVYDNPSASPVVIKFLNLVPTFQGYGDIFLTSVSSPVYTDLVYEDSIDAVITIPAGQKAYLVVYGGWDWELGTFTFDYSFPVLPPYDNIANALPLTQDSTDHVYPFIITDATQQVAEGYGVWGRVSIKDYGSSPSAIISIDTPGISGTVRFYRVNNAAFNPASPNFSYLSYIDAKYEGASNQTITFNPNNSFDPNKYIYIHITGNSPGTLTLTLRMLAFSIPYGDNFAGDYLGDQTRGYWAGYTEGSTREIGEPTHGGVTTTGSVWVYYKVPHTGNMRWEISRVWGTLNDPVLAIYTGSAVGSLTPVASDSAILPSVDFAVTAGTYLRICVAKRDAGDNGGYILNWAYVTPTPLVNEDPSLAVALSGQSGSQSPINLVGTYPSIGDPYLNYYFGHDYPAWYKWTATDTGVFKWTVTGSRYCDATVYIEDKETGLLSAGGKRFRIISSPHTPTGSASTTRVTRMQAFAGQEYYIQINMKNGRDPAGIGFNLSWLLESPAQNFHATSSGAWNSLVGGASYSGAELVCGAPGAYAQYQFCSRATIDNVNPGSYPIELERTKHWLSFYVKYNSVDKFVGGYGQSARLLEIENSNGDIVLHMDLDSSTFSWESDNIPRLQPSYGEGAYGITEITQEYSHIQILLSENAAHFWMNGTYCGYADYAMNPYLPQKLRLGIISDSTSTLDLKFKDVYYVSDAFYDEPPLIDSSYYGWTAVEGFEHKLSTADYIGKYSETEIAAISYNHWNIPAGTTLGDSPGRGRGAFGRAQDVEALGLYPNIPPDLPNNHFGWWVYLTTDATTNIQLASFRTAYFSNDAFLGMSGVAGTLGQLYIAETGSISGTAASRLQWLDVALDKNRWHHIEIAVISHWRGNIPPHVKFWINGVAQQDYISPNEAANIVTSERSGHGTIIKISIDTVPGISPAGANAEGWVTDITIGRYNGARKGPVKTALYVPDASGSHVVGNNEDLEAPWNGAGDWGSDSWMYSTDGGATYSAIGGATSIHGYIDEWPPTFHSGGSEDFVAELSYSSGGASLYAGENYVAFSLQDVGSGETVVAVSPILAYRGFYKYTLYSVTGNLLANSFNLTSAVSPSSFATKLSNADGLINITLLNSDGGPAVCWTKAQSLARAPGNLAWTPARVNSITAKWGWKSGLVTGIVGFPYYPSGDWGPGTILDAYAFEVAMVDSDPAAAPLGYNPPAPIIPDYVGHDSTGALDSCNAENRLFSRTDPNMYGTVWFDNYIFVPDMGIYGTRYDTKLFWRVTPAQDVSTPGLDGSFHDTPTDELNHTTSWDSLCNWKLPSGEQNNRLPYFWYPTSVSDLEYATFKDYYRYGGDLDDPLFQSDKWYFDACQNGRFGTWDSNRHVTFEAYWKDKAGNVSTTTTWVLTIEQGLCCLGAIHLSRLRFRAFQNSGL